MTRHNSATVSLIETVRTWARDNDAHYVDGVVFAHQEYVAVVRGGKIVFIRTMSGGGRVHINRLKGGLILPGNEPPFSFKHAVRRARRVFPAAEVDVLLVSDQPLLGLDPINDFDWWRHIASAQSVHVRLGDMFRQWKPIPFDGFLVDRLEAVREDKEKGRP